MTDRSDLVRAIHQATDGTTLARAVAALDNHDLQAVSRAAMDRELDLGAHFAAQRLTPVPVHELHTAATDWLLDAPSEGRVLDYRTAMIAEATTWYRSLDAAVRFDGEELAEQARGRARTLASAYAAKAPAAEHEFLQVVGYLRATDAASGLPQIDQTIDPNNNPSATPYPTEVFPTFGEEQDPFNGVETNAHGSGAASDRAPMLQQLNQQNGGGSGYGSGPEKPLTHDEGFNTQYSYAEVPLGAPGTIPSSGGAQPPQQGSAPTPMMGQTQDAGSERRQTVASVPGYSYPDPFGYRWLMTTEIMHPFHERCAAAHWPDEACGDNSHTASVAIGYQLTLEQAQQRALCEATGVREGLRAIASAQSLADLAQHHNRLAAAWGESERGADDTAVLHGFMAVVRPVLAERGHVCHSCSTGNCQNCEGDGCTCNKHGRKEAARGLADNGGVTKSERQHAKHHLPGTDKFPVDSGADVINGEHALGRTSEPKSKVVNYLTDMAHEYGVKPPHGGKSKKDHAKAASL